LLSALREKIRSRDAVVGVIGLGYVGLPLILEFSKKGFKSIGFDIDDKKVDQLNSGISYITHIPAQRISEEVNRSTFTATDDFSRLAEVDVIIICVPTPLSKHREPDLSYAIATAESIVPNLKRGHLVILESTTYPGTTENELRSVLERSGLSAGIDFFLAFSPEREDPGNKQYSLANTPKIVGGVDPTSLGLAVELYTQVAQHVVPVSNARTAEAVKLMENIFRAVNIALINELKIIFTKMDIDIWEVIEAAKTKPFGFMPFYPGPGLGGHCIPIDPFYLTWAYKAFNGNTKFIELAGEINTAMPDYVLSRLTDALNDRGKSLKAAKILLIGIAYKKDVSDVRESPGLILMEKILAKGAETDYYDPHVKEIPKTREHGTFAGIHSIEWEEGAIGQYDAVLIVTDHSSIDYHRLVGAAQLVVDCRNATAKVTSGREKIVKA
jgi:UDP-N-acetyl-D-glucosamine dehydrogenase